MSQPASKNTDAEAWAEIRRALETARDLTIAQRRRFLDSLAPDIRHEVETLLAASEMSVSILERPVLPALAARLGEGAAPVPAKSVPFVPFWAGNYLMLRKLGEGGMGEVFLAKLQGAGSFERLVAVKRAFGGPSGSGEPAALFEHEAKLSAILTHANIIHVYDFREVDGAWLLAMEYVDGKNLSQILRKAMADSSSIPLAFTLHAVLETARALEYAHTRHDPITGKPLGIIHRDVSPKNIMISYEGDIRLLDFGIAKSQNRATVTATGLLVGTLRYLSPEIADGLRPDQRSDVYSLSVVLYELLAGKSLFDGDSPSAILAQVMSGSAPIRLIEELPVHDDLKQTLLRGLARDREARFQSAGELADAIERFLGALGPGTAKAVLSETMGSLFATERAAEKEALARNLASASRVPRLRSKSAAIAAPPLPPSRPAPPEVRRPTPRRGWWPFAPALAIAIVLAGSFIAPSLLTPQAPIDLPEPLAPATRAEPPASPPASPPQAELVPVAPIAPAVPVAPIAPAVPVVPVAPAVPVAPVRRPRPTERKEKRLPSTGTLELLVDEDVKVYLGTRLIVEVNANQLFRVTLPSGPGRTLRFVNEARHINVERSFQVDPGTVLGYVVDLK